MKTLVLIRHAKTELTSESGNDYDRKLKERGVLDALQMALRLKQQQIVPDMIVSSSAMRAQQTANIFANALGLGIDKIKLIDKLYHAMPDQIDTVVASEIPAEIKTVFLVGHNPGITYYAADLGGITIIDSMPTCAAVVLQNDVQNWIEFTQQKPTALLYDFPKNI